MAPPPGSPPTGLQNHTGTFRLWMCSWIRRMSDDDFARRVSDDKLTGGRNGEGVERELLSSGLNKPPSAGKIGSILSQQRCCYQRYRCVHRQRRSHDRALTPHPAVCSAALLSTLPATTSTPIIFLHPSSAVKVAVDRELCRAGQRGTRTRSACPVRLASQCQVTMSMVKL